MKNKSGFCCVVYWLKHGIVFHKKLDLLVAGFALFEGTLDFNVTYVSEQPILEIYEILVVDSDPSIFYKKNRF